MSHRIQSALLAAALAAAASGPVLAREMTDAEKSDGRIELGYLSCEFREGSSIVVKADRTFDCVFSSAADGQKERYTADITNIGLDLMVTDEKTLRWAVLAPSTFSEHGVLEGEYGGVSADAALGYSVGADVLLGGFGESIALQPVALSSGEGLGASIGLESMVLSYQGLGEAG